MAKGYLITQMSPQMSGKFPQIQPVGLPGLIGPAERSKSLKRLAIQTRRGDIWVIRKLCCGLSIVGFLSNFIPS